MTDWEIHGVELTNCNCNYGCACQFNALPKDNVCEAAIGFQFDKGHYGDISLDGLRAALVVKWPNPIHEGNGVMQIIIDESADDAQRAALQSIMTGGDTDDMATMWWVFSAMSPTKLETLYKKIDLEIDLENRVGKVSVPGVFEMTAEPIRNPVTGDVHRARIDLPHGFEYALAELASGTTKTSGELDLTKNNGSHAHLCELHMTGKGVIREAA